MSDENVPASAISTALSEAVTITFSKEEYDRVLVEYSRLQSLYEAKCGEFDQLSGSSEAARAQLIKPYAWAVLQFLCGYGAVVAALLFFQGFKTAGFHLNDTVMGVIVGSTAVSAIGLVLTVVRGLFPVARG